MIRRDGALRAMLVAQSLRAAGTSGLTAMLVLFLISPTGAGARSGVGLGPADASSWFAVYLSLSFLTAVPAAWVVDRATGPLRGYFLGLVLCLASQLWIALDDQRWLGALVLLALSAGLAKDSYVGLIAATPSAAGSGRHAALTKGQLSLAVGSILGPLASGLASAQLGWRAGFAVCAAFSAGAMVVVVAQWSRLAQLVPERTRSHRLAPATAAAAAAICAVAVAGAAGPGVDASAGVAAGGAALTCVVLAVLLLRRLRHTAPTPADRRRDTDFAVLFVLAAVYWIAASFAGSVVSLFVQSDVDRSLWGFTVPTAWFQSVGPLTVLVAVPLVTARMRADQPLWRRAPGSVTANLVLTAAAVAVLASVAASTAGRPTASMLWPIIALVGISLASVLLSPTGQAVAVGLGQGSSHTVALWFLATACGIAVGGFLAQLVERVGFEWFFAGTAALVLVAAAASVRLRGRLQDAAGAPSAALTAPTGLPGLIH